jgi:hypothetical protein
MMITSERQRRQARIRARRARAKHDADFRKADAERQRSRRAGLDPNIAREYQRERRFRFTKESKFDRSLKEAGLSIVSEMSIKVGLFIIVFRGKRTRETLGGMECECF